MWVEQWGLNVVYGHGAFELCLPSLGFFFTKLTLRFQYWANVGHMAKVRALAEHGDLQHYEVSALDVQAKPGRQDDDDQPEYDVFHLRYLLRIHWA